MGSQRQLFNLKHWWFGNFRYMTYGELLVSTAQKDERIVVMTAENRALVRNAQRQLGNRFIDTGITEQTMVGMAAGLALRGRIPIVHALAPFLTMRAFEFIRTDVGIAHLPVKLSGYIPGFLSDGNGPTHQSIEDVAIMRGIPGMEVYSPADEDDLVKILPSIWGNPAPAYVRINHLKGKFEHAAYVPGRAEVVAKGKDVTLLVYGFLFANALQAKELLGDEGLSVGLVNMRSLKPVDEEAILRGCAGVGVIGDDRRPSANRWPLFDCCGGAAAASRNGPGGDAGGPGGAVVPTRVAGGGAGEGRVHSGTDCRPDRYPDRYPDQKCKFTICPIRSRSMKTIRLSPSRKNCIDGRSLL